VTEKGHAYARGRCWRQLAPEAEVMKALKILIVDDDEDFAVGLIEVLELDGHCPTMARTGRAAITALEAGSFDVALIDIGLPDMNGAECLNAIRARRPDLPCFVLTGYSAEDVARQGVKAEAVEILTKPVNPDVLGARLARTDCAASCSSCP
jgi:DNA-binding NtrC family response regulator